MQNVYLRSFFLLVFIFAVNSTGYSETRECTVYSNRGWQDSGLTVAAGVEVSVVAYGQWTTFNAPLFGTPPFGPDGGGQTSSSTRYRIVSSYPLGALIARIVPSSGKKEYHLIGSKKTFTPSRSGKLQFTMNDNTQGDNSGKMTLNINLGESAEEIKPIGVYRIYADKPWQNSGIMVRKGLYVDIYAEGEWTTAKQGSGVLGVGTSSFGPQGGGWTSGTGSYIVMEKANVGSLICKIGMDAKRGYLVGNKVSFKADKTDFLYFMMNDSVRSDNEGSVKVSVCLNAKKRDGVNLALKKRITNQGISELEHAFLIKGTDYVKDSLQSFAREMAEAASSSSSSYTPASSSGTGYRIVDYQMNGNEIEPGNLLKCNRKDSSSHTIYVWPLGKIEGSFYATYEDSNYNTQSISGDEHSFYHASFPCTISVSYKRDDAITGFFGNDINTISFTVELLRPGDWEIESY